MRPAMMDRSLKNLREPSDSTSSSRNPPASHKHRTSSPRSSSPPSITHSPPNASPTTTNPPYLPQFPSMPLFHPAINADHHFNLANFLWKQQAVMAYYSYAMAHQYKDDPSTLFNLYRPQNLPNKPLESLFLNHPPFPTNLNYSPPDIQTLQHRKAMSSSLEIPPDRTHPSNIDFPVDLTNSCNILDLKKLKSPSFQLPNNYHQLSINYQNHIDNYNNNYNNHYNSKYHPRQPPINNLQSSKKLNSGGKKLVGIRFLFPPFSDHVLLYDRAKMWVARHEHKYFVDWSADDLLKVDQDLRPLHPISRQQYKIHMNRSEFCRNVKLRYCLQTKAPWAEEFCQKLQMSPVEGGFTGLCQAKIAAADLWRSYSENYRSHQARQPNRHKIAEKKAMEQSPLVKRAPEKMLEREAKRIRVDTEVNRNMEVFSSFFNTHQFKRFHELLNGKNVMELMDVKNRLDIMNGKNELDLMKGKNGLDLMNGKNGLDLMNGKSMLENRFSGNRAPPPLETQASTESSQHLFKYSINGILSDIHNNYRRKAEGSMRGDDKEKKYQREFKDGIKSDCDSTTDVEKISEFINRIKEEEEEEEDDDLVVNVDDDDDDSIDDAGNDDNDGEDNNKEKQ